MAVDNRRFWKRHAYRLPRPWRNYASCHGTLRACYWFPRWRDSAVCTIRGHVWQEMWDGEAVMCGRCATGPVYRDDPDAWHEQVGDDPVVPFREVAW